MLCTSSAKVELTTPAISRELRFMRTVAGTAVKHLSDRNARPVGEHARGNIHGRQLLEEQLGSVGNKHLRNSGLVLARSTLKALPAEVPVCSMLVIFIEKVAEEGSLTQ